MKSDHSIERPLWLWDLVCSEHSASWLEWRMSQWKKQSKRCAMQSVWLFFVENQEKAQHNTTIERVLQLLFDASVLKSTSDSMSWAERVNNRWTIIYVLRPYVTARTIENFLSANHKWERERGQLKAQKHRSMHRCYASVQLTVAYRQMVRTHVRTRAYQWILSE